MPNPITVMPEFSIVVHDEVRTCCHSSCEWLHPDYCVLSDEYLDYDEENAAYVRTRQCLVAEMQADNYHTFVPQHIQEATHGRDLQGRPDA